MQKHGVKLWREKVEEEVKKVDEPRWWMGILESFLTRIPSTPVYGSNETFRLDNLLVIWCVVAKLGYQVISTRALGDV